MPVIGPHYTLEARQATQRSFTSSTQVCVLWLHEFMLPLGCTGVGISGRRGSDEGGYHFVFMPTHLFPAYPSYRWWAVIADRYTFLCPTCDVLLSLTGSS